MGYALLLDVIGLSWQHWRMYCAQGSAIAATAVEKPFKANGITFTDEGAIYNGDLIFQPQRF